MRKCEVCGKSLDGQRRAGRPRRMCADCAAAFLKCRASIYAHNVRVLGLEPTPERRAEWNREAVARTRVKIAAARKAPPRSHPCPYCGKPARTAYCTACTREGFDYLHMETGRTNGWDRPAPPPRAPVEGGWRGRPCAGPPSTLRLGLPDMKFSL